MSAATSLFPRPLPPRIVRVSDAQDEPRRLHATLRTLQGRVKVVQVTEYGTDLMPVAALEEIVRAIASDVRAALDDIGAWYSVHDGSRARSRIDDTATLGRMELNAFVTIVTRGQGTTWERIAACDSVLQVCRRCLRVLEGEIAEVESFPYTPDDTEAEVAVALEIRRAYVELHRAVTGDDLPDGETIRARLRTAGNCIARTLGCNVATAMRVHDQYVMRGFQQRIRAALLESLDNDASSERLIRLWQDLTSFTSLLLDVSKRVELRNHDRDLVSRTLARVESVAAHVPVARVTLDTLRACEGRDPELDALLASGCTAGALRYCLTRLRDELTPRSQNPNVRRSGTWAEVL